ncbi:hypothetical protein [Sandaracinobacteroides saxicola]|uniref:hypothetical protein n=1 Tax=Sandaracinobacteroides saxicola TaxID=2759707 RepID=UPI001A9C2D92|nr:hypothetical protein [Sandaracinobacteroides saxicola]
MIDRLAGSPRTHAFDRWIFVFTAATFVVITLAGFVPDSLNKMAAVAAGKRPPFPMVMHAHAVLMGSFLLLLLAQTYLAATDRVGWHKRLGISTVVIVPALVIVGFMLAPAIYHETVQAAQAAPPEARPQLEAVVARKENILLNQMRMGILCPLFIAIGLKARRQDAGLHKRMMILATAVVLGPAIVRIPGLPTSFPTSPVATDLYMLLAIAPMVMWDIYRNGYVHRAYLIWLGIGVPFYAITYALWDTPWWHMTSRAILQS